MKKILFIIVFCCISFITNAQWRRQYIPGDELRGTPSEWSYIYDEGDRAITFTDSGLLMIVTKYKKFRTDRTGTTLAIIGVYRDNRLVTRGQFRFPVTPDGHAAGSEGFKDYLKMVRSGAIIRVIAPVVNDFDYEIITTRMYEGQRVIFNQL